MRRLAAALNENGPEAVKWQKAPDRLNEILELVDQAPKGDRGPSWEKLKADLIREQAVARQRSIDPSDRGMRLEAHRAIRAGKTVYPAPALRTAIIRVIDDVADILPEGIRAGALEKLEPLEFGTGASDPKVRATYRTPTGERFALEGQMSEFTAAGAFFDPDERVIVLNTFGRGSLARDHAVGNLIEGLARHQLGKGAAPAAGIPFDLAIRALLFHEVLHVWWRDLDDWVRDLLVSHAKRLGVLEMTYHELWAKTHWEPRVSDARGQVTVREAYTEVGATPEVLDNEAVAHMVQLAVAGALKADDLAPVRQILEALFNGDQQHMARAIDGDTGPRMEGRLHALEGPRPQDSRLAEMEQRRAEHVAWQLRQAEHHEQWWLTQTAFMREGDGNPRNPVTEMLAQELRAKQLVEIIEACRS